jgi:rod shape-determining protein MreC
VLSLFKRYRELIVVGALLVYPFGRFFLSRTDVRDPMIVDRVVLGVTGPLQRGLTWLFSGMGGFWSNYLALRGVHVENVGLKDENTRLVQRIHQLEEATAEQGRLKELLQYGSDRPGTEITARVLGYDMVPTLISIRIDRGETHGVRRGMPVVTARGVVGKVHRATGSFSDIVLITDPNSRLGARIQRSRARVTAAGAGKNLSLKLENALRLADVQDDDLVITSGTDTVFPPGLVVGTVTGLAKKNFGLFQSGEIVPAVDFTKLEEVLVIPADTYLLDAATSAAGGLTR